jgi:CheY-like chemotaxis protein
MLAYSGKGRFVIRPVDVNRVIKDMTHLIEVSVAKTVVLRFQLAEDLPPIKADVTQVRQTVMNLVTNASEATGDKSGVVCISTGAAYCSRSSLADTYLGEELPEGNYVSIEVSDTGCGLSPDEEQRIFDPFYSTKFTGRGLGLAAVLGIVRSHKGAIRLRSRKDAGTKFSVLFPACEEAVKPGDEGRGTAAGWRGSGTVLLVDDDETIRALGKTMLERLGFSVVLAEDGREAVGIYRDRCDDIACVILDLTMPHMGGEEAFRKLCEINRDVRVILCSGYTEDNVLGRFGGNGPADFLQKPYKLSAMADKLRRTIEASARHSEPPAS